MKSICLIFLLSFSNLVLSETLGEFCRRKEGASEADELVMTEHRAPKTRLQKCFFDCVFQHLGWSDGKQFRKEGFLEEIRKHDGKKIPHQGIEEAAARCDGLKNEDRCELAAEITACIGIK